MKSSTLELILNYLDSQPRNKIIFHRKKIFNLEYVNLGFQLAQRLYKLDCPKNASHIVPRELEDILQHGMKKHPKFGYYLALENLGFLFESELKIDFPRFLESQSQNNGLFLSWEGEIEEGQLFFLTKGNGIKININNLSHITI